MASVQNKNRLSRTDGIEFKRCVAYARPKKRLPWLSIGIRIGIVLAGFFSMPRVYHENRLRVKLGRARGVVNH